MAKHAAEPTENNDKTQDVIYTIVVKNYSLMPLKNVQIGDNLKKTIPSPSTFKVVGNITSTGTLKINNSFNGITDTLLLNPLTSTLDPGKSDTIVFRVNITPNNSYGPFFNTAFGKALDTTGTQVTRDASTDGFNPDPNGDKKPLEDTPTVTLLHFPKDIPVKIPNGFSPNNDGNNDGFYIDNPKGYRMYFAVYNRWGNLIYENSHYDNSWKGDAKSGVVIGNQVPDGTYFFVLEFTDENSKKWKTTGFLTISR